MRTENPPKQSVLGVGISVTSYAEAASAICRWVEERRTAFAAPARYVCVTSVHGIVSAVHDEEFRSVLNGAAMATPDGMPVVWAMRSFGVRSQNRVYGPNLMLAICERAAQLGQSIYLYGAREETLTALSRRLTTRFPNLRIAGHESPPFRPPSPEEDACTVKQIIESRAGIVFVGLSTPKQERWMAAHTLSLPGVVMVGVGAAFDFHAGNVRQAPAWIQNHGLEWLFRLLMEPRRLWKRYASIVPVFLPLWALQKAGVLRYETLREDPSHP